MPYQVGDPVTWTSQAGGVQKTKSGIVVAVVAAKTLPERSLFPQLYKNSGIGMSRDHESYVVRVKMGVSATRDYWPRANALSRAPESQRDLAQQIRAVLAESGMTTDAKLAAIEKLVSA